MTGRDRREGTAAVIRGFREFVLRGNVIDLAVAVVIGAAFTAIVNVIVSGLVSPLIGVVFQTGSLDEALQVGVPTLSGGVSVFSFGAILAALINFLAVAVVVYFVFVVPMNRAKQRAAATQNVTEEPAATPSEAELLLQIRDILERQAGPRRP